MKLRNDDEIVSVFIRKRCKYRNNSEIKIDNPSLSGVNLEE